MAEPLTLHVVTDELFERYEGVARRVGQSIRALIPDARVEHVGATSVPGLITKGDLDVAAHVAGETFEAAVGALDTRFSRVHEAYWVPNALATYRAPPVDGIEISVQLVAIGGERDFFVRVRDVLRRRADFRAWVNRVKRRAAPSGMEEYRAAKLEFYAPLLAWRASTVLEWYDFEEYHRPPGGTEVLARLRHPDGSTGLVLGRYEEEGDLVRDATGRAWGWETPVRVVAWAVVNPPDLNGWSSS